IAIAAPKPNDSKDPRDPLALATIDDLFNSANAGFALAKADAAADPNHLPVMINSGPLGAGAFGGDAVAAYVTQDLAAMQTGFNQNLWGSTQDVLNKATADVNTILRLYSTMASQKHTVEELLSIPHDVLNQPPPTPTTPTIPWSTPAD